MCGGGGVSKTGFVFLCYGKIPGLFQIFSRSAELFQGLGIREKFPLKYRNTQFVPAIPSFDVL